MLAGIEIGGSKTVVATAGGDGVLLEELRFPTTDGAGTLAQAIAWLRERGTPQAIGIASFGPLQLDPAAPGYGTVLPTPKPGWTGCDILRSLRQAFPQARLRIGTDVGGAALAEAGGLAHMAYITVGTGIGAGIISGGRLVQGHGHPEFGHIRVPRIAGDTLAGTCPFHGDCLEGLAAGPALLQRWGLPAGQLPPTHQAWDWQARYLAQGLLNLLAIVSPQRIVVGGGLSQCAGLHARIEHELRQLAGGYFPVLDHGPYIVPPHYGQQAGVRGALLLALQPAIDNNGG